jgi:hypothetical protein
VSQGEWYHMRREISGVEGAVAGLKGDEGVEGKSQERRPRVLQRGN